MKGCRPVTDDEALAVVKSFRGYQVKRERALWTLGTKSGLRISELLSLRLGDIAPYGTIAERVTVERKHMKKKIEGRTVLIHPAARAAIEEWVRELRARGFQELDTFLFRSRYGSNRPISRVWAWRILKRSYRDLRMAGKLGCHTMRKTFADRVYEKLQRDLIKTQQAMGHKSVNSTASYLSFRQEEIDQAILSI